MTLADQLTVARAASVVLVVALFEWDFQNHLYWATAVFMAAMATDQIDGWIARRQGRTSALGSMLDPVADKVLVLAMLIMVVGTGAFPSWMVALIVARELLVSGLRLAAIERGVVIPARDLSKLKTWAQAVAAAIGGFAAAGLWSDDVAWWALLVALVFTLVSGLEYARAARRSPARRMAPRSTERRAEDGPDPARHDGRRQTRSRSPRRSRLATTLRAPRRSARRRAASRLQPR